MKNKGILSALVSFFVLFLGIIFIITGSIFSNFLVLLLGLTCILLAGIAYLMLIIWGILWLRNKEAK